MREGESFYGGKSHWICQPSRYHRETFELIDMRGVPLFEEPPPDNITLLDWDQALAVAMAVKKSDVLERAVSSSFDKEVTRKHLDLLDKALSVLGGANGLAKEQ